MWAPPSQLLLGLPLILSLRNCTEMPMASSRPSPGSSLALRDQVTTPEISCFRLEARTKEALHEIPHVSLTTLPESLLFSSGITSLAILTMPRSHFCEVCPSLIFVSFVQTLVRIKWDHLRPHEQVWQLFPLA